MYSFDVFDTLITRITATPTGVFALMQKKIQKDFLEGIKPYVKENFFYLRVGAEEVARNTYVKAGVEEVTIEQIYGVLVKEHLLTEGQAVSFIQLEQEIEKDSVRGIPSNIKKVKQLLLEEGEKVVLISDMYLDRETIQAMLRKADPILASLPLYVSSDQEKKGKWTGELFRVVQEREQVSWEEWHHCGDNLHSDYEMPKRLGIVCERYDPEGLLEVEKEYLKGKEAEAKVQLLIGCARVARIYGKENTAYRLGCSIGGVILYPYVNWLVKDCVEKGIQRLYFIARDGFIIKELADVLIQRQQLEIETKYLYGSRMAWRIPSGENWKEELRQIYWRSYEKFIGNSADLAAFLQIPEEEMLPYLSDSLKQPDRVWTIPSVNLLLDHLLANPNFSEKLYQVYQAKKELLVQYLKQEVDTREERFAFVDMAGSGFTQECLAKVMREYYSGKIQNYFYRKDMVVEGICKNYVFYPYRVPYYIILEMMSRAPHGQTVGYREGEGKKIYPVLSKVDGEALQEHGVSDFIEGAKAYTKRYDPLLGEYGEGIPENQAILFYLEYVYYRPEKWIREYFGDMPNMLTGRETKTVVFAPKLTKKEIRKLYWLREKESMDDLYRGSDLVYSVLRCSEQEKKRIAWYQKWYGSWYGKLERKIYQNIHGKEEKKQYVTVLDFLGERVAIYGAGKKGQEFYQQVTGKVKIKGRRYHSKVVLWIDQNANKCQKEGLPVVGLEQVRSVAYDQLVIAIAKKETAEKVKQTLLAYGVPEEKIFWVYDC